MDTKVRLCIDCLSKGIQTKVQPRHRLCWEHKIERNKTNSRKSSNKFNHKEKK